jgi:hypothetical protein
MERIRISKDFTSVNSLIKKIKCGTYQLDIDYKKDNRKQCNPNLIIEAAIYGLELPAVHLKYNKETIDCIFNAHLVMVFAAFIDNKFHLIDGEFDGKKFEDLQPLLQGRIEDFIIQLRFLISADVEQTKYYISHLNERF